MPDVVITKISWEPAAANEGDEIVFIATIKNIGTATTPTGIKHGVAFSVDNGVVSWSDTFFGPLAPGEEKVLTANGGPSGGPKWKVGNKASYAVKAHVNDQKDFEESNYDNNFFETVLTPGGKPDLIVTDIWWTPAVPKAGDQVTFFATIKNIGSAPTPSGKKHGIAFSANGSIENTWCDAFFGPLAPGEEIDLSTTMAGSSGKAWACGSSASYVIRGQINDDKQFEESDYDNNFYSVDLVPGALPDVIISNMRWEPENPQQGDIVNFFATIKNIGKGITTPGQKHGVAIQVDGSVVTWSDHFYGHISAGREVEVSSAQAAGSSGAEWKVGTKTSYAIKAEVNDTKNFTEADYSNNFYETTLLITTGIQAINNSGKVYFANGALQVTDYPASAVLRVYNLMGVNVSGPLSASAIKNANLTSGIYVVEVQSEGKTFTHKVVVK
jgi:hypothetical protein